jgi:hypothetical protein
MAKAEIILPNGTKINIEGTSEEIIKIKEAITHEEKNYSKQNTSSIQKSSSSKRSSKEGPLVRIRNLIEDNFFKEKRTIEDVRKKLEEKAIFYKVSDLSTSLIRLVKKGELRRLKEENQWRYVNS